MHVVCRLPASRCKTMTTLFPSNMSQSTRTTTNFAGKKSSHTSRQISQSTKHGKGGSVPDPLVWSSGAFDQKKPESILRDLAWLPGPSTLWTRRWQGWPRITISPDDVAGWPCSVSLLVKFSALLETLCWPSSVGR